jgi:hypothetical protein
MKIERRCFNTEVRAKSDRVIEGYAAEFGAVSDPIGESGGFLERIAPGAFSRAIKYGQDVRALFNHDPNMILGRTKSGTLKLSEDTRGLFFECNLPATSVAADLVHSIRRGDISGCSFSFSALKDEWPSENERILRDVDLFDVGPVTYPAYSHSTTVAARSLFGQSIYRSGVYTLRRRESSGLYTPPAKDEALEDLRREAKLRLTGLEI